MKKLMKIVCAAVACGCVAFAMAANEPAEDEKGIEESESLVKVEASAGIDSRYMTYGVIDGKDPIARVNGYATFLDWWYIGGEVLFDLTKGNGKRGGYGNRAGKYTTLDIQTGIAHEFFINETLGRLGVDFYTTYEYIPRHNGSMDDTDYVDIELKLGDLWLEPRLWIERDLMADNGTYVNLELGHEFALVGDEEDPTLAFRPSVAQGLGNSLRTKGYFAESSDGFSHGGLMDTTIKGELTLKLCDSVSLAAYVAYSDYLFDSTMRDAARERNAGWGKGCDHSWSFYGGLGVVVSF